MRLAAPASGAALCDALLFGAPRSTDGRPLQPGQEQKEPGISRQQLVAHAGMMWVGASFGLWNIVAHDLLRCGRAGRLPGRGSTASLLDACLRLILDGRLLRSWRSPPPPASHAIRYCWWLTRTAIP